MKLKLLLSLLTFSLIVSNGNSQTRSTDSTYRKFFVGSSLFVLGNFIPDDPNPPDFVQLNLGYRLTPKDVFSIELKTWRYAWPLGIPWGNLRSAPEEKYPGYIREFGVGLVYQRFLWKGLYASIDAANMLQKYVDLDNKKIQNGYQLFMTYRLGYHIQLFKNRFFLEPSVSVTHWPIKSNVPESFAAFDNKWPNYFLFEPGLHFGVKF